ncbi:potassium channel protein [Candidatus Sumerlaeota bacterium]|nr:potassium channel protein [Candidatus Sumerlaeota bacterium]
MEIIFKKKSTLQSDPTIRRIYVALSFLLLLILWGGMGFHFIEHINIFDAIYMVIITLTTIGYGDFVPKTMTGRAFAIGLIIVGFATVFYTMTLITHLIIEGEIHKILGRRKLERFVQHLRNHFVICGYGRIGKIIAQELARKSVSFVIIENDEARFSLLEAQKLPAVFGDATSDDVLEKAGIRSARGLIAVTRNDSDNLFITLSARTLNPELYIITRSTDEANEEKFLRAGANKVICPYRIGALQIAQSAIRPNVIDFLEIATHRKGLEYALEEMRVHKKSSVCHRTLNELALGRTIGVIVVGIRRNDKMIFNPSADTEIKPEDILIALGNVNQLSQLEKMLSGESG